MKKILKTLLMLTCVFTLTACGAKETLSEYQIDKMNVAEVYSENVIQCIMSLIEEGTADRWINEYAYNNMELKDRFDAVMSEGMTKKYNSSTVIAFDSEGKGVRSAFTSFMTGIESLGDDIQVGEAESVVDDDTIVVNVPISGNGKNGNVELIFTNDIFYTMTSCTLNLDETMGSLMVRAGLNTLLGMGTVFVVLVIIIFIISAFNLIPKVQAMFTKKKEEPAVVVETPAALPEEEDLSDDMELVAVIAAAIAAYEGTSADGFRVRSIKRANTNKWKKA